MSAAGETPVACRPLRAFQHGENLPVIESRTEGKNRADIILRMPAVTA
jgi:hypothetical protein